MNKLVPLGLAFVFCLAANALAGDVLQLEWSDLMPEQEEIEDPFATMPLEQLDKLGAVVYVRDLRAADLPVTDADVEEANRARAELERDGVDADAMIALADEIYEKRLQQGEVVNAQLDGRDVRIPGYLLPLEFDGTLVTEFLLVPYIGACIHVPPPPPNQIVFVTSDQGFEIRGLYTPVWVNGAMRTEKANPELFYVDGTSNISVGYVLDATQIRPYSE